METSAQQDEQFLKWITSVTDELYWECDEITGGRVKLKLGWEQAQIECDRIAAKGLRERPRTI